MAGLDPAIHFSIDKTIGGLPPISIAASSCTMDGQVKPAHGGYRKKLNSFHAKHP
jgi:hypothetical protein